MADVPELRAIDAVVSLIDDELLGGVDVGQRARLIAEVPFVEEEGAFGEAGSDGVGVLSALAVDSERDFILPWVSGGEVEGSTFGSLRAIHCPYGFGSSVLRYTSDAQVSGVELVEL